MPRRTKNKLKVVAHYIKVDGQVIQVDPKDVPGLPDRCRAVLISCETGIPLSRIEIGEDAITVYVETEEESVRLRWYMESGG
jgi:hypothetical protein